MKTSNSPRNGSERAGVGLAKGLGWYSFGLGIAELVAPRALARLCGVKDSPSNRLLLRLFGARELMAGASIFMMPKSSIGTWSRVAGDAIDIAALVRAMVGARSTRRPRLAFALGAVAGVTALDVLASLRLQRSRTQSAQPVTRTITINKDPMTVYEHWRDFSKLPRFMSYVESVEVRTARRSHWVIRTPLGVRVGWDAEITQDVAGECIAWRTLPNAKVPHRGSILFRRAPDGRRTEVVVEIEAPPVTGAVGQAIGKLLAGPQIEGDLRRFKQVLETGGVVHSDASIHTGMHPAQPPAAVPDHQKGAI